MLAILSPAKSLDFESGLPEIARTEPRFPIETDRLVTAASNLSKPKLKRVMPVSDSLIELNHRRYRDFWSQPERQAIYAFAGDVYRGFEAKSLEPEAIDFAQDHVRILSGLYGLLRPLDRIRPYRLEMGTRWAPRYRTLVDFWGGKIARQLADDLDAEGSDVIVNLASQEYWAALDGARALRGARIIAIDLREERGGEARFISFEAKRARGLVARYICEHRLDDPEALKGFDTDGYRFDAAASEGDSWRLVRTPAA
ncbi:MAG: peroxide stress protein YaaA [Sphingomonadaceae bacterium]|nr:peroxide stress protein YaaA [Sphingomonadaceae bacterium]